MATLTLTVSYNNQTIVNEEVSSQVDITYNGSTIASNVSGTKTVECSGQVMASDLVIGGKTLLCNGKLMANDVIVTVEGGGSRLPDGYQEVEWVGSTGTQYIKIPNFRRSAEWSQDTDIIMDVMATKNVGLMGQNGRLQIDFRNPTYAPLNTRCTVRWFNGNQYLNDNVVINSPYNNAVDIGLFGFYDGTYLTQCKLYNVQIKISGSLRFNFIPCYRKSDNVIGMYDLVNSIFYTNAGTGTFSKGEDVL